MFQKLTIKQWGNFNVVRNLIKIDWGRPGNKTQANEKYTLFCGMFGVLLYCIGLFGGSARKMYDFIFRVPLKRRLPSHRP